MIRSLFFAVIIGFAAITASTVPAAGGFLGIHEHIPIETGTVHLHVDGERTQWVVSFNRLWTPNVTIVNNASTPTEATVTLLTKKGRNGSTTVTIPANTTRQVEVSVGPPFRTYDSYTILKWGYAFEVANTSRTQTIFRDMVVGGPEEPSDLDLDRDGSLQTDEVLIAIDAWSEGKEFSPPIGTTPTEFVLEVIKIWAQGGRVVCSRPSTRTCALKSVRPMTSLSPVGNTLFGPVLVESPDTQIRVNRDQPSQPL